MIDASTADQLDALGTAITALQGADAGTDANYLALIAPVMLAIDGRTMPTGFRYTLNVTNALQGRPKHWFLELRELAPPSTEFAVCGMHYAIPGGGSEPSANVYGNTIGLAACACICHTWAQIVRMWLAGNYPSAVTQPG